MNAHREGWLLVLTLVSCAPAKGIASATAGLPVGCEGGRVRAKSAPRSPSTELAAQLLDGLLRRDKVTVCKALEAGADPNLKVVAKGDPRLTFIRGGPTPAVVVAAWVKDPWFMETIIIHGGDPNADSGDETEMNGSVFVQALFRRNEHLVPLLIAHGLDLHRTFADGTTPLDDSVATHLYQVTRQLLAAGAVIEKGKEGGKYFFDMLGMDPCLNTAAWTERDKLLQELRKRGYQLKFTWEGQTHCAPPPRPRW
jgi:hypothetical protein